ncbi:uncharacterized protein SETTUDRAFT_41222 [Exserohilum turcica Et28A]|uniref:Uncharacterized protein n=1 Tax=Exserohilum turcicum (strain 28A) TaxID=671987 RepID=R0IPL2_EXST2|nr:uncharacterized protein SETTUDRAFT_41222 [Exserohilum turcica Et28A]EOA86636.1 hypothetical protein SETTUDRAFT_41222 [Exserohilum turcica Et28A]
MAELVELGFTGLDKFADRYWDQTYNHLPALPRPGNKKRRRQQQQQQRQQPGRELPQGYSARHPDKGYRSSRSSSEDAYVRESEAAMHGPDGQDDYYYDDNDDDDYARGRGYYERVDYRAPGPGLRIPREQAEWAGPRNAQVAAHAHAPPAQTGYAQRRPAPQRRRSSWSPARSGRRGPHDARRARSQSRSRAAPSEAKQRLVATLGGALVGGRAGGQPGQQRHQVRHGGDDCWGHYRRRWRQRGVRPLGQGATWQEEGTRGIREGGRARKQRGSQKRALGPWGRLRPRWEAALLRRP